jgi:ribosomal protein S18 acetylase RimI-like enzyme
MQEPAKYSVIETLRDGREVEIRALRPEDRNQLEAAIARMSNETLYHRFFVTKHHFSEKDVAYFLNIDFVNHVALVALANESGKTAIVGSGRYIVLDAGRAEASFAVIDEYQGQGVGSALMRHLVGLGRQAGLRELVAEVMSDNAAMLKVFERSGLETSAEREGPYVHVTLRFA